MSRSKAQGRKGKQKNKPQKTEGKDGNDKIVAKKESQAKHPNDKMSRSERQKMIKAKYAAGEMPERKNFATRSQAQKEKPKSKEELDKEMEDYEVAIKKLDENADSYLEQIEAEEDGKAGDDE